MKKLVLIVIFAMQTFLLFAQNPSLPLFQAFDGRYNNEQGVTISEISQSNNYYYSIKVRDNQEIVDQLLYWAKDSEKFSHSISRSISNGKYNIVFQVPYEDTEINVGLRYPDDKKKIDIFMQADRPFLPEK